MLPIGGAGLYLWTSQAASLFIWKPTASLEQPPRQQCNAHPVSHLDQQHRGIRLDWSFRLSIRCWVKSSSSRQNSCDFACRRAHPRTLVKVCGVFSQHAYLRPIFGWDEISGLNTGHHQAHLRPYRRLKPQNRNPYPTAQPRVGRSSIELSDGNRTGTHS